MRPPHCGRAQQTATTAACCVSAALLLALLPALPAMADGQVRRHLQSGTQTTALTKPAIGQSKTDNPSHVASEGGTERPLWIDTSRVVEFAPAGGTDRAAIRPAEPGELVEGNRESKPGSKSSGAGTAAADGSGSATTAATGAGATAGSAATVSPVFVDASGQPRALPGGVIVSLKQSLPEPQARAQLEAAGLTAVRQLGERMWLVASPVGIASLELANRLHATGAFEFAQPNWWQPRHTK